jgi:hypothetical protein
VTVTTNDHGAVLRDGLVVGWVSPAGSCENDHCAQAALDGLHWHATPRPSVGGPYPSLPDNHFATRDEAIAAVLGVALDSYRTLDGGIDRAGASA